MYVILLLLLGLSCTGHGLRRPFTEQQLLQRPADALCEHCHWPAEWEEVRARTPPAVPSQANALARLLLASPPKAGWQFQSSNSWLRARHQPERVLCASCVPLRRGDFLLHGGTAKLTGGFVDEMRKVAMKMHTREQAPREGEKEATETQEKPVKQWQPTAEGYLKFLVESKVVYDCMEAVMAEAPADSPYHVFKDTGLERGSSLKQDIAWLAQEKGLEVPQPDGAGAEYAKTLKELANTDTPAFICHFYNQYFAHSAGGRMIGNKVSEMVLDGKKLNFYTWDDLQSSMADTKAKLNAAAETWTPEEKEHCLEETAKSFKLSGDLLKYIAS
mmetsp:Transcript_147833/g.283325  ORF Transcript_147833/g.283325 Transcript_147833/m.283325 type:complete len:331 (-) Transcript_147833:16-1008(-)